MRLHFIATWRLVATCDFNREPYDVSACPFVSIWIWTQLETFETLWVWSPFGSIETSKKTAASRPLFLSHGEYEQPWSGAALGRASATKVSSSNQRAFAYERSVPWDLTRPADGPGAV